MLHVKARAGSLGSRKRSEGGFLGIRSAFQVAKTRNANEKGIWIDEVETDRYCVTLEN